MPEDLFNWSSERILGAMDYTSITACAAFDNGNRY